MLRSTAARTRSLSTLRRTTKNRRHCRHLLRRFRNHQASLQRPMTSVVDADDGGRVVDPAVDIDPDLRNTIQEQEKRRIKITETFNLLTRQRYRFTCP